ncbi:MAG TPA: hypothetical protein VMU72_00915 [Gaiellaceae bacterium]|nr:hypothetical protein [Gaiellaceae bacterium]
MRRLKAPSPAMVVALIALFVALGGTGYAARNIILSSPSKAQIIKIVKGVAPTLSVKSAAAATRLPSGKTETGLFTGGGSYNTHGWIGLTIMYPRPLAAPIRDSHIIDVQSPANSATHCSGAGHAARGYLCLYNVDVQDVGAPYFYSSDGDNFPASMGKYGVMLYWETTADDAYVGGSWAVTAP